MITGKRSRVSRALEPVDEVLLDFGVLRLGQRKGGGEPKVTASRTGLDHGHPIFGSNPRKIAATAASRSSGPA